MSVKPGISRQATRVKCIASKTNIPARYECMTAIKQLNNGRAPSADNILPEMARS